MNFYSTAFAPRGNFYNFTELLNNTIFQIYGTNTAFYDPIEGPLCPEAPEDALVLGAQLSKVSESESSHPAPSVLGCKGRGDGGFLTESFLQVKSRMISHWAVRTI